MCTQRILGLLKEAGRKAAVASYSLTNTTLYWLAPEVILEAALIYVIDWFPNDLEESTKTKIAEAIASTLITSLAIGLLQATHSSYSKVVDDYKKTSNDANSEQKPPSVSCWRKFTNYGGAVLKTAASSISWYQLVNKIPYVGGPVAAAVTTALSVPGNLYTQIAFLAQEMKQQQTPSERLSRSGSYQPLADPVPTPTPNVAPNSAPVIAGATVVAVSNSSPRATAS
jgi:hypothetical protein